MRMPLALRRRTPAIGAGSLEPYLGPCRVIHGIGRGPLVKQTPRPCAGEAAAARAGAHLRARAPTAWSEDFAAFAPETIALLAAA